MSLKAGIVGLPNVGKSTLFNAITKQKILSANYPFATIEPNVGMVTIKDERLDFLNKLFNPKSLVPNTFEFTDIAGLVKGASKGEGLGNKFLSHIRETDAIIEVVRCFDNQNIIHVDGNTDPIRDIETINIEFIFCDLEVVNNRIGKIEKKAISSKDKEAQKEVMVLKKIKDSLENNISIRNISFTQDEKKIIKPFNFLTAKPIIYVANVDENEINTNNKYVIDVKEYAKKDNASVIVLCAKIEEDLAELSFEEKEMFLNELGIKESGLNKLVKSAYNLLGLKTFFTAGEKEVRAWTFKDGMKAPECAGIIHSDFEKGFIKAEIISFSDMKKFKGEKECKEAGKLRIEGKEYKMQDGDICLFRFNV